jgi:hypothetical protein
MCTRESILQRLTAGLMLSLNVLGLSAAHAANSEDPPDRVARVSYLKGEVSLKPAGTTEWALTTLNRPLTTDDQLSLDRDARAELQVGSATIHLDEGAAFSFSELSDAVLQARVTDGAMHLTVRRLHDGEVIEIDTPQAAVTVTKPGDYRIEVMADGTRTQVKTYDGQVEVVGNGESVRLQAREQLTLDEGQAVAGRETFSPRDEFDNWAQARNERSSRSASSRYVAPDVIGYEDLDGYGDWRSESDYGHVWYPRVVVGWSPYRDGHWAWVSPWGWTWVDNAPWGFAPFHYGRWAHVHGRWGWVPGPIHVRAVYAPALVGWVGAPGFSVSVSFGSHVGWFPLAPREVYVPGYYCSPRHIHNVNYANTIIVNNTIINRAYVNRSTHIDYRHRGFRDAVTVVTRDAFVAARPVSNHIVRNRDIGGWRTHNAAPAIAPDRASALGPRWNANASRTPEHVARSVNREVISRRAPPPSRGSFEQEQRAIRDNNNRPIPRGDLLANANTNAARTNSNQPGQRNGTWFRDDHPRRAYDRARETLQPNASLPSDNRSRDRLPRERETARIESPRVDSPRADSPRASTPQVRESVEPQQRRQLDRQFERQPDRQSGRQPERQYSRQAEPQWPQARQNVERPRPVERTERNEAPRRYEPPPQREQRQEPAQRQAPPTTSAPHTERHEGRGNRRTIER